MVLFYGSLLLGSSPPVRGAHGDRDTRKHHGGLIPARAGSTMSCSAPPIRFGAHPRPCGEHSLRARRMLSGWGSSPPVRGALASTLGLSISSGLIPARAGSTAMTIVFKLSQRAHPRPCGEHERMNPKIAAQLGSSPPVRGARVGCAGWCGRWGLIPARAGSTSSNNSPYTLPWAHPRPCGEHTNTWRVSWLGTGSSPPVRGALVTKIAEIAAAGLIPARAGSTYGSC